MKRIVLAITLALVALVGFAQSKTVAHRGYWQTDGSAQNSLTSLRLAAEEGCWGSEFDVWITKDGVCVVHHDADINGVHIESADFSEIRDFTLANGEKLPSLEQYLWEGCHYPDMKLVLEIKPHSTKAQEDRCVDEVLRLVKKYNVVDNTDYISFSMNVCERLVARGVEALKGPNGQRSGKKIDTPEMHVAYLNGDIAPKDIKARGLTGIDYEQSVFDKHPEWIAESHDLGLSVNVWTVNDLNKIWNFIVGGVDYITTNRPVEAKRLAAPL